MTEQTYRTIVADPDWRYGNYGAAGAARAHYPGTEAGEIAKIPVGRWARRDAILLLWATWPHLDGAVDVMRSWGFRLVTGLPWVKTTPRTGEIKRGIGFWWQSTSELLLVGRRGKAAAPKHDERVMGLLCGERDAPAFYAPRGPHSRKPPSLVEWIESRLPGPYLELYARVDRPGWTCWGHATGWHLDAEGVSPIALQEANQ